MSDAQEPAAAVPFIPTPPVWKERWFWVASGVVVILVIVGAAIIIGERDGSSAKKLAAFDVCKDFVKDRLRAPATATFRNPKEGDGEVRTTYDRATNRYRIQSTVDAENGFGAKIRNTFTCTVEPSGENRWRLVDIALNTR